MTTIQYTSSFEDLQTRVPSDDPREKFEQLQTALWISNKEKDEMAPGAVFLLSTDTEFLETDIRHFIETLGKTHFVALSLFKKPSDITETVKNLNGHSFNTLFIIAHGDETGIRLSEEDYEYPTSEEFKNFDKNGSIVLLSCQSENLGKKIKALLKDHQGSIYVVSNEIAACNISVINKKNTFHVISKNINDLCKNPETGLTDQEIETAFYEKYNYLAQAAAHDHADAITSLGFMHLKGISVPKDSLKAQACFERAHQLGNAMATTQRGLFYFLEQNLEQARKYFEISDQLQNITATRCLGEIYLFGGRDIEQDTCKALQYLTKAYESENPFESTIAGRHLGIMNLYGIGMERSLDLAYAYLEEARESSDIPAIRQLAEICLADIENQNALERALSYLKEAADLGDIISTNYLNRITRFLLSNDQAALEKLRQNIKSRLSETSAIF